MINIKHNPQILNRFETDEPPSNLRLTSADKTSDMNTHSTDRNTDRLCHFVRFWHNVKNLRVNEYI